MVAWLSLLASFGIMTAVHYSHQTVNVADSTYPITRPPVTVSIVIPAYNEEAFIERTLLCIQTQNVYLAYPELFEVIVVDNECTDSTAQLASSLGATVASAPRGKLNAKATGVDISQGDIIVFLDADNIIQPNFLNLLLRHFHNPKVVAVSGNFVTYDDLIATIANVNWTNFNQVLKFQIYGCGNAVLKSAWYAVGGHNLAINQQDRIAIWMEEEFHFMSKLKQVGDVVVDSQATVLASARFQHCLYHGVDETCASPYCLYCRERSLGKRF